MAWIDLEAIKWPLTFAYLGLLSVICFYGAHRFVLLALYRLRAKSGVYEPEQRYTLDNLPTVTVQLPMFNEGTVAERIIDAACKLDYPLDKLQVQVLDDSTDESVALAEARCDYWRSQGIDIQFIHRVDRSGYKAGAMDEAMDEVKGELVAVFDSDFVPERDFLLRSVHAFTDPEIGMVQTRWEHLNREQNWLTRAQAIFLDGHFLVEHPARHRSNRWIHFNGTGGLWRKTAILEAGNWSARTLSEDLDLSIRAQLKGWKLAYLPQVDCPAELPPQINAYKTQQHRWAKGTTQCLRKLYPKVLFGKTPWHVKTECFFQFTWPVASIFVTLSALLYFPAFYVDFAIADPAERTWTGTMLGGLLFVFGFCGAAVFYAFGQRIAGRSFFKALLHVPLLVAVGSGIALTNTRGVLEALFGHETPFLRTPKFNDVASESTEMDDKTTARSKFNWVKPNVYMPFVELAFGLYMVICIYLAIRYDVWEATPLLACFAAGYIGFGYTSMKTLLASRKPKRKAATEPAPQPTLTAPRPAPTFYATLSERQTVTA